MTLHVLSLNDQALSIGNEHGILARSQGCVVECEGTILFGSEAAARSRLYPVTFSNRFWHELDMEPLIRSIGHFRHHADIAHAHLVHLAQRAEIDLSEPVDTMVLVPGTFGAGQLATLLGIMQHSPFRPVALVDAGALAGATALETQQGLHLDMQLHEMVVTALRHDDTAVRQEKATAVPGLGWHQLESALAALTTDAFVRQARFNPRHDAQWEQRLHDLLPQWLRQTPGDDDNLLMVLEGEGQRHQARLTRSAVEQRLRTLYRSLAQSVPSDTEAALVLAERCATLPGLRDLLGTGSHDPDTVRDEQLMATGLSVSRDLCQPAGSRLRFSRSVPVHRAPRVAAGQVSRSAATHALSDNQAWPLQDGAYCCVDSRGELMLRLEQDEAAIDRCSVLGEIRSTDGLFQLYGPDERLLCNGRPCREQQSLYSGDRLQYAGVPARSLQLIRVHDG